MVDRSKKPINSAEPGHLPARNAKTKPPWYSFLKTRCISRGSIEALRTGFRVLKSRPRIYGLRFQGACVYNGACSCTYSATYFAELYLCTGTRDVYTAECRNDDQHNSHKKTNPNLNRKPHVSIPFYVELRRTPNQLESPKAYTPGSYRPRSPQNSCSNQSRGEQERQELGVKVYVHRSLNNQNGALGYKDKMRNPPSQILLVVL